MSTLPNLLAPALVLPLALGVVRGAPAQDELPDLKSEIDHSIRWLRSTQHPSGAYGDGVVATAFVLRAFAESPRHYARQDGPFVAKALEWLLAQQDPGGAIAEEGASAEARLESTRIAVAALYRFTDATTREAFGAALAWLGEQGIEDPYAGEVATTREPGEARARAAQILAERHADGYWTGEHGRVLATAERVVELSGYSALLAPEKAARKARALPAFDAAGLEAVNESLRRGAAYLFAAAERGRWGPAGTPDAGITAMVLAALQATPEPRAAKLQETIDGGLAWLASLQREDGSIHQGRLASYVTSAAVLALARSGDAEHTEVIERAREYLVGLQADEGEGYDPGHHYYGGIGYGGDERPDLSNLQMALEALTASGLESNHEAYARALRFLDRCQNRSESNDLELAIDGEIYVAGDDGGAAYMPGNSPAGYVELEDGRKVARSYGSMTYALLKGFIFAGVPKDDPRMKACWKWLQENYTLDVNPGFELGSDPTGAYQGLFYYFHTMAKALDLYGAEVIVDRAGAEHDWRRELCGRLVAMQSKIDGSWVNENSPRWWEGNPVLATAYALLTLDAAKPGEE